MIVAIIALVAVIITSRLWLHSIFVPVEESSGQLFDKAWSWQRQLHNFERRYDANLIRTAIRDFKAKHNGRLPELEEITKRDDEDGILTWQYTDLQQISDHNLSSYRSQELNISAGQPPVSDESFYGVSARLEQASFPDEDNIPHLAGLCLYGRRIRQLR